jgi:uncharacterized protein (DUF58 family)
MQLYPTRSAAHLAIASIALSAVGVLAGTPAMVGWGGAILVAVAIARAVTLVSVARIRAAGFEMLWTEPKRVVRALRGAELELEAEVRNRDTLAARYVKLRALHSPNLDVTIEPSAGEVTATGRLKVKVRVRAARVGQHGLYGLALEVRGAPGMFEVPLTFANPYGIDVSPRPLAAYVHAGRGARSALLAPSGRAGRLRGEGSSLRELREHQPGDPFRRIAWRASARRGKLLVRELEREERDVVWVVLDASVELWSGPVGRAPLDQLVDEAAALLERHLGRGDRVGLAVVAQTPRATIAPDSGPQHGHALLHALVTATSTLDASRSDLDELDVAIRVIEHLRPLDDRGLADVARGDLDKLARRADAARARAPFRVRTPEGRSERDAMLRRYLGSFGIDSPPRLSSDRKASAEVLISTLGTLAEARPRASIVHVLATSPEPSHHPALQAAIGRLRRRGSLVAWMLPDHVPSLVVPVAPSPPAGDDEPLPPPAFGPAAASAAEAVKLRAVVARRRAEEALSRMGARIEHPKHRAARPALPPPEPSGEQKAEGA